MPGMVLGVGKAIKGKDRKILTYPPNLPFEFSWMTYHILPAVRLSASARAPRERSQRRPLLPWVSLPHRTQKTNKMSKDSVLKRHKWRKCNTVLRMLHERTFAWAKELSRVEFLVQGTRGISSPSSSCYLFKMSLPSTILSTSFLVFTNSWTASDVTPLQERRSRREMVGKSFKNDKHLSESFEQPLRRNSLIKAWPHTLSTSRSVIPRQKLKSSLRKSGQCWTNKRRDRKSVV